MSTNNIFFRVVNFKEFMILLDISNSFFLNKKIVNFLSSFFQLLGILSGKWIFKKGNIYVNLVKKNVYLRISVWSFLSINVFISTIYFHIFFVLILKKGAILRCKRNISLLFLFKFIFVFENYFSSKLKLEFVSLI